MVKAIHVLSANLGKSWNKQPQYDLSLEDPRTKKEYLADKQTNEQKDRLMNMQTDGETNITTYGQTEKQTDRQSYLHIYWLKRQTDR